MRMLQGRRVLGTEGRPDILSSRVEDRVNVGILTPGLQRGGAERVVVDWLRYLPSEFVNWIGVVASNPGSFDPSMLEEVRGFAPVVFGSEGCASLVEACDLILAWGQPTRHLLKKEGLKVILVSHGVGKWTGLALQDADYADAVVAVSEAAKSPLIQHVKDRAFVINNCVDLERLKPKESPQEVRARWGVPQGSLVAGYLGRFTEEKNPTAFASSGAFLPEDWSIVGVGWGALYEAVANYARAVRLGSVYFPGSTENPGDVLRAFDVLVVPSWEEAHSIVISEAWALGVPVVSTSVGLLKEPRAQGLYVPITPGARGQEIANAIQSAHLNRGKLIKAGERFAMLELDPAQFAARWAALIRWVMKN